MIDDSSLEKLKNRWYRLTHFYFIQDKEGEVVRFKPNIFQRILLKSLHFRNIILKARQLGISTFIAILFLDDCLFKSNTPAAIVADKEDNAKKIFEKVIFAWDNFPQELKDALDIKLIKQSTTEIEWSNGSKFIVGTTIHGGTYRRLHISELGPLSKEYPDKARRVLKSAIAAVPQGGLLFIESTAEGEDDYFKPLWDTANEDMERASMSDTELMPLQLKPHFFPWWMNDEYRSGGKDDPLLPTRTDILNRFRDLEADHGIHLDNDQKNWYIMTERTNRDDMQEQYPSTPEEAFRVSGEKLFDPNLIKEALTKCTRPKEVVPLLHGELLVWKNYVRGHRYAIGADVAEGVGRDSSAAVVIDFTTKEQIASYKSSTVEPYTFGDVLAQIGRMYACPLIAPEANNVGGITCRRLYDTYPSVFTDVIETDKLEKKTERLGFRMSSASVKASVMWGLDSALKEEHPLTIYDETILKEARAYQKGDNYIIQTGRNGGTTRHFDLLISCAIANKMFLHANISIIGEKQRKRIDQRREEVKKGSRSYR
jgi:hypothetical protein